jgi:D-alanine--(R)-lactate ligase
VKVGLLFGGASEEHPISVKSAREVSAHLDREKYEVHHVGITRRGAWRLCDGPAPNWEERDGRPALMSPDREARGLIVLDGERHETIGLDVVFPVLHGRGGEDGAVQGLLELAGIPYVGCDLQSSALCMDKSLAYLVAASAGIATPRFWTLAPGEEADPARFAYPAFVKPARSGSSFGVSKVSGPGELAAAVEVARRYDAKVVVEQAVVGSEVGCALSGPAADPFVGEVDRIALSHGFFRIHQEDDPESGSDNATFVVPADIPPGSRARVRETAKAIYRALGCSGLARVDMFLTADGEVVLNEVNTFPGMTSYSRYPRMMAAAGVSRAEAIDRMVAAALAGGAR